MDGSFPDGRIVVPGEAQEALNDLLGRLSLLPQRDGEFDDEFLWVNDGFHGLPVQNHALVHFLLSASLLKDGDFLKAAQGSLLTERGFFSYHEEDEESLHKTPRNLHSPQWRDSASPPPIKQRLHGQ